MMQALDYNILARIAYKTTFFIVVCRGYRKDHVENTVALFRRAAIPSNGNSLRSYYLVTAGV
jgi:hypothetical protein